MDTNYKFVYPSTKVLLLNGISKAASELQVGDILLSPDPHDDRTILTITPFKSTNYMVISRYCNSPFIVSELHMLPVTFEERIVLINVKTYPLLEFRQFISLIHEGAEFLPIFVTLEPYILGLWLHNNNKDGTLKFSKHTMEVAFFLFNFIQKFNLQYESDDDNLIFTDTRLIMSFFKYDLMNNPRIPDDFKYNTKKVRSRLLSGFIDNNNHNPADIAIHSQILKDDFCFVAHSLGFLTQTKKINSIWYVTVLFDAQARVNDFKLAQIEDDSCLCLEVSGNSVGIILSDFTVI